MRHHVTKTCQAVYLEISRISSICHFLTEEATKTLVTSCILSRLDYCNALLIGCPSSVTQPLQTAQNAAARLICRSQKRQRITHLLYKLHWLPDEQRIKYKIYCLVFKVFTDSAP